MTRLKACALFDEVLMCQTGAMFVMTAGDTPPGVKDCRLLEIHHARSS